MKSANDFSPDIHMTMLQFILSNSHSPDEYDAITIDVQNALAHCARTNLREAKAKIKSFPLSSNEIQELLPVISFDTFNKYFSPDQRHLEIGYLDEGLKVHYVVFSEKGIYCSGSYRQFYEGNPLDNALSWFWKNYASA